MRQVYFSPVKGDTRAIDLVFFVNGLPVATLELKTHFKQEVRSAIDQYKQDRVPKGQPLLGHGSRALVHFAVDDDEVWMTTRLAGAKTVFLPFNQGTEDGGKGNPVNRAGEATAYLWESVLERESWLNILGSLMFVSEEEGTDPITGRMSKKSVLMFPRFHQWQAVTSLVAAARAEGAGQKYLIQHSAGSGKSNSIAWTAHRLARLHDNDNRKLSTRCWSSRIALFWTASCRPPSARSITRRISSWRLARRRLARPAALSRRPWQRRCRIGA